MMRMNRYRKIHDEVDLEIERYLGNLGNREKLMPNAYCLMPEPIIKNFIRPFDLSTGAIASNRFD
jgi:hypothetical protein